MKHKLTMSQRKTGCNTSSKIVNILITSSKYKNGFQVNTDSAIIIAEFKVFSR